MKELKYISNCNESFTKKEVSVEEYETACNVYIKKKWTCKYFVKSYYRSMNKTDLDAWIKNQRSKEKKNCHVLRTRDTETGNASILSKTLGDFYIVNGLCVLRIVYLNYMKINFVKNEEVEI